MRIQEIYHNLQASRIELLENRLRIQEEMMYRHHDKFLNEISSLKKNQQMIIENQKTMIFLLKRDGKDAEPKIKNEIDDPGYWHLLGDPVLGNIPQDGDANNDDQNADEPGEHDLVVDDEEVRVLKFLDLTRDQEYRKMATMRRNRIVSQLQSENEIKNEPEPFSIQDKKNLLRYMKSRASETVIGPPLSPTKFEELYPGVGPWTTEMTRLSDFSNASRRNTIKNFMDGDMKLPTIQEEESNPQKRKQSKTDLDEATPGPSSKRFRPSTALKKVGRKFTKFDDDLHEYMAQDERESKYEDTIFDSDEDSDGFEPKSKQKPKKKKSTKKSV